MTTSGTRASRFRAAGLRGVAGYIAERPALIISPFALAGGLLLWDAATRIFRVPVYLVPPPLDVWRSLVAGFAKSPLDAGGFWYHTGVTAAEALLGFALGSAVGVIIGIAISHWRLLEQVAYPYIVGFQALPKVAIAPLLVIWFGFGMEGKVVITSVITFFPLMVNTVAGYQSVDPDRLDLARSCDATEWQILWKIILPSSLPFIFAGLNVASVLALLGAIVGEFVGAEAGLGMLLMQYNNSMQVPPVFAVLLILSVLGYLMNHVVRLIERRVCFWAQPDEASVAGES